MKRVFTTLVTLLVICLAACFQSCEKEAKYTVWTEVELYSQFESETGITIKEGCYIKMEITNEQWEQQMVPLLTNEGKHYWSEAEIKKWLVGCGFGEHESTKESSWLVMADHGILAAREGNRVNMIVK